MIRVDAVWLAVEPVDLRLGPDSALARVVAVFGAAQPHHAYLFTNRRATRLKVLVHDGFGLSLLPLIDAAGDLLLETHEAVPGELHADHFTGRRVLRTPVEEPAESGGRFLGTGDLFHIVPIVLSKVSRDNSGRRA